MAKSALLARLLDSSDLAQTVPRLPPEVLHRVIQICGLEDCGEFVALATPAQIARILDADVWRPERVSRDEALDADRFGLWIEVLMESGGAVAAEKLRGLDIALVIAGLAQHAKVLDHAAVAAYETLDGQAVPERTLQGMFAREIGGYVVDAKRTTSWEAIVDLLLFLHAEDPGYFQRLMIGCLHVSSGSREADGLDDVLPDGAQKMFDLASGREARREQQGFVTPAHARAFLQMARQLRIGDDQPPSANPIARAYFRDIEPLAPSDSDADGPSAGVLPEPVAGVAGVIDVLRDEGVLTPPPRALLEAARGETSRLALIREYVESSITGTEELAYLANTMMAGCSIQGRPFTPQEASDAAVAICNLGLENWPSGWLDRDLVTAFQAGWTILHRDVCMFAARRMIEVVGALQCGDREIQLGLNTLRIELKKQCRAASPWLASDALEVIVMLDAPSWAALVGLIAECPVIHGAISASQGSGTRTISASAFEFISDNAQIAAVREFMRSLPAALVA